MRLLTLANSYLKDKRHCHVFSFGNLSESPGLKISPLDDNLANAEKCTVDGDSYIGREHLQYRVEKNMISSPQVHTIHIVENKTILLNCIPGSAATSCKVPSRICSYQLQITLQLPAVSGFTATSCKLRSRICSYQLQITLQLPAGLQLPAAKCLPGSAATSCQWFTATSCKLRSRICSYQL